VNIKKDTIINYIANQQTHHKQMLFKDEWIDFIEKMGVKFDERDWDR
jgi:hypothetical protein